jgi:RES domain-containing protein
MILYRFAHKKFAEDLSGTGAKLVGGRWNSPGIAVIYTSESISLALLEVLANAHTLDDLQSIRLMEIEIPHTVVPEEISLQKMKKDWFRDIDYTQYLGTELLQANQTVCFRCPSAIVHREHNYLLNPAHTDFKKLRLLHSAGFYFDARLFKQKQD